MKVKKDDSKNKKKKNKVQQVAGSGIKKQKKQKKVKIESNTEVGEAIKKELNESVSVVPSKIPLREEKWRSYLKVFLQHEKLNKKQKQIIEFCTNKGVTAPRRKTKFLNFVRHCYTNQSDVTDEQVYKLFDVVLQKYLEFKSGNYHNADPKSLVLDSAKPTKLSKNKRKKINRSAEAKTNSSTNNDKEGGEEKRNKVINKKKKRTKGSTKLENNVKMETDD